MDGRDRQIHPSSFGGQVESARQNLVATTEPARPIQSWLVKTLNEKSTRHFGLCCRRPCYQQPLRLPNHHNSILLPPHLQLVASHCFVSETYLLHADPACRTAPHRNLQPHAVAVGLLFFGSSAEPSDSSIQHLDPTVSCSKHVHV